MYIDIYIYNIIAHHIKHEGLNHQKIRNPVWKYQVNKMVKSTLCLVMKHCNGKSYANGALQLWASSINGEFSS